MADLAFAIHLGGGLYLDSDGTIHEGVPPDIPVYQEPFKLPGDPKVVRDALKEVKTALKDINKDPSVVNRFEEWGLPFRFLNLLSVVGKIAGVIAPVFAVASFAVDVLKLFGLLKDGPSALETLVKERFKELEDHVEAIAKLINSHGLRDGRIAVEQFTGAIRDYTAQLQHTNPTLAQLENDRNTLIGLHGAHVQGIATLLDPMTWLSVFDADEHGQVWLPMQNVLFTLPGGVPTPATVPPDGVLHFDHRLMVPMATFAAESYLAAIRGISPEFRTTGDFRSTVRIFAKKIDDLAKEMRKHVLARTIYTAANFTQPIPPWDVVWSGGIAGVGTPQISPKCSRFPVGALDLRYHTDLYFEQFLNGLFKSEFLGWPQHPTKLGGMNLRWIPPAKLAPTTFGNFSITNPQECVDAANAQAEKDYADLLAMSGYTELVQLAVLFRHESTAPDKSQTVRGHKPFLAREPQASSTVTVKSEPILMSGVISSSARREPQKCAAWVEIWTQPIKRARPVQYQVKLRTLRSISSKRWKEPEYSKFHWAQYESDLAEPGFMKLEIYQSTSELDAKPLVVGWHSSPRDQILRAEGTLQIKADTFDWWIPVKPPFDIEMEFSSTMVELRALGAGGQKKPPQAHLMSPDALHLIAGQSGMPMQTLSHHDFNAAGMVAQASLNHLIPELYWKDGDQTWDGEHRMLREEQLVTVEYKLEWEADRLYITLRNDPKDRNYVLYVVVEEKMPGTGQILHTAVPVPVNGQLTYVPQKFFDEEREAYRQMADTMVYFKKKYAISAEPGPLDPVGWLQPGDLVRPEALELAFELAERHDPELLHEAMAAVRSRGPRTAAEDRLPSSSPPQIAV